MAVFRCAACGSPNVVPDTQTGGVGYNYVKGTIGTVVLGPGGGAAGVESKREKVYRCPDCGLTLSYTMDPSISTLIDQGVRSLEARRKLRSPRGVPISWEALKAQYKNIESGYADEDAANSAQDLLEKGQATRQEFDAAVDLVAATALKLGKYRQWNQPNPGEYTPGKPMTLLEYTAVREAIDIVIENMARFLPSPLPKEYRGFDVPTGMFGLLFDYAEHQEELESGRALNVYYENEADCLQEWLDSVLKGRAGAGKVIRDLAQFYEGDRQGRFFVPDILQEHKLRGFNGRRVYGFLHRCCRTTGLGGDSFYGIEGHVSYYFPLFSVRNGCLCFWDGSFGANSSSLPYPYEECKLQDLAENYFSYYPEKRAAFMKEIEEYKAAVARHKEEAPKNKEDLARIPDLESKIKENDEAIIKLGKKLFGKTKALAQIEERKKANEELAKQIEELLARDKAFQEATPLSPKDFIVQQVEKNDFFLAWHAVREAAD